MRACAIVRWTVGSAMVLEAICIVLQAARGTTSHYNVATTFDATIFNLMGIGVLVDTIAMAIFLWLLRRDTPASRAGWRPRFAVRQLVDLVRRPPCGTFFRDSRAASPAAAGFCDEFP